MPRPIKLGSCRQPCRAWTSRRPARAGCHGQARDGQRRVGSASTEPAPKPKAPNALILGVLRWRWGEVSASRLPLCPPSSRAARPARGCSSRLCLLREPRVARVDASVRMWLLELLSLAAPRSAGTSSPRPLVFATRPAGSALAFAPAPFRTCCRFPSSSDGRFRTRTPTPRGVARTHERLSSRGSVLCL